MSDTTAATGDLAAALERSDGFQLLARALPDAILVIDPGGDVSYASVQSEAYFGRRAGDIVGRPFLDLVAEGDRTAFPSPPQVDSVGSWDFRAATDDGRWLNAAFLTPHLQGLRGTTLAEALGASALCLVRDLPSEPRGARDRTDLLRRALDATDNIIVVTDPQAEDNPIVVANDHFFEVTGYSRDEVIGRNCRFLQRRPDGTRDDDQDGVRELKRAIEAGESTRVLLRNYTKGGRLFYNELYVTPVHDHDGRVVNFVGVQNDVTARIEAEREALGQASLLRAFFDSAPVMMGVIQRDSAGLVHRTANARAAKIYGRAPEDMGGTRSGELGFTEREAARWLEAVETCAERGGPVSFETTHPWDADPDGDGSRSLQVTVSRVEAQTAADRGELFSYIGEDVTTARRSARERRLLSAAVDQAAEAILVTDAEAAPPGPRILYANRAHGRVFGYEPGEVVGQSPRIFQGPKTDRAVLDRVRRRIAAGEPFSGEVVNYRKDGAEFVLEWDIAPVRDDDGRITNWVGTQRDVTERRRLEHEVLEVAGREQERMARELHDGLGQLLVGAQMQLAVVERALQNAQDLDPAALAGTVARASEIVGEAHGQARAIARGLFPVNIEPDGLMVALERLTSEARESLGVDATFTFEVPVVVGSSEQAGHLYRIVQEAMTNAVRHGHAEHVAIGLSDAGDGTVALTVQDDGVGIDDDALDDGAGLGMRTMAYRARRVGGALDVRALDGGGTAVRVRFTPAPAPTYDGPGGAPGRAAPPRPVA